MSTKEDSSRVDSINSANGPVQREKEARDAEAAASQRRLPRIVNLHAIEHSPHGAEPRRARSDCDMMRI